MIKKIGAILCIASVVFSWFYCPVQVEAKTLGDFRKELAALKQKEENKKNEIKKTESEIKTIEKEIEYIYQETARIEIEIANKTREIEELNRDIVEKEEEIDEILLFFQASSGESEYLEYVFGASSIKDMVYRIAIVEQLSEYNSLMITEMNELIEANEKRKVELSAKQNELNAKHISLADKVKSLGGQKQIYMEDELDILEEIKNAEAVIKVYVDAGCKENEDVNVCASKQLPSDTKFWRPLDRGFATSEFGWRVNPITGRTEIHTGIDVSVAGSNIKVYSAAAGKVVRVGYDNSSGNFIAIHHTINGKSYTTMYLHLATGTTQVKEGQLVTKDTQLAIMGSTGDSTGPHLHFTVATGHRYKDYVAYADFVARCVNPRTVVNFPAGRGTWVNRTTQY